MAQTSDLSTSAAEDEQEKLGLLQSNEKVAAEEPGRGSLDPIVMYTQVASMVVYLLVFPLLAFLPGGVTGLGAKSEADGLRHFKAYVVCTMCHAAIINFAIFMLHSLRLVRVCIAWRLMLNSVFIIVSFVGHGGLPLGIFIAVLLLDAGLAASAAASPSASIPKCFRTFIAGALPPSIVVGEEQPQIRDWFAWVLGWIGFFIIFISCRDLCMGNYFFTEEASSPIMWMCLGSVLPFCFTSMFAGHARRTSSHIFAAIMSLSLCVIVAPLWHAVGMPGFMVANLAVFGGLAGASHLYTILWQSLVSPRDGEAKFSPSLFLIAGGAVFTVISTLWFSFSGYFPERPATLAPVVHRQDLFVGMFAFVVAIAASELKEGVSETPAFVVSWWFPMAAMFFSTETKAMVYLEVGHPFHPSWTARGLGGPWGAPEIMNITFFVSTVSMFAIGSTYTCFFVLRYTECTKGWRQLLAHGALMIPISGWFMAIAVSGMGAPLHALDGKVEILPAIPTLNKVEAAGMHRRDLTTAMFLMAAGPMGKLSLPEKTAWLSWPIAIVCWVMFIISKVRLIMGLGWEPATPA